jgi:hypothetical protein
MWGLPEQLSAASVDALRILIWQQTKDGAKGQRQPKPIPRPGIEPDTDTKRMGKGAVSMEDMDDFLGWSKELADPEPVRPVRPVDKVTPVVQVERGPDTAEASGPDPVMQMEHDCTICKPPRKRDARGRFTK